MSPTHLLQEVCLLRPIRHVLDSLIESGQLSGCPLLAGNVEVCQTLLLAIRTAHVKGDVIFLKKTHTCMYVYIHRN